jgi:beta-glucosidase
LPQALDYSGGWLNETIVDSFTLFADTCFKHFGSKAKRWLTFNEPLSFTTGGYLTGTNAPGRCSDRSVCPAGNSSTEPYIAAHHVLLSHASAVDLYRRKYAATQKGKIGITLNSDWAEPYTEQDVDAAERHMEFMVIWSDARGNEIVGMVCRSNMVRRLSAGYEG